ncbi:hypothetical protein JCGZ_00248 [Jatropha curcas]|uniref:PB1 domain-containing protein n=1 Tax=Jatropha curcas TaxID=180498 RepID=A0A067L1V2_JATCU|nr:uncharacterized protein LOC105629670 [Jatropha curcas]KDP42451.1 hypothetical protein JCGZ_00248 [Jatropha curcas]
MAVQAIATDGGGGSVDIGPASGASSPKNRIKFLCSYGGKILPRPTDGHLKYVGGDTRVIAVPRDITYTELMKKLRSEFDGDVVLKYQVMPEDLDVLVSVRTNEDLKHMLDEYDRHESEGIAKLRAFLFPSTPIVLENLSTPTDPHAMEHCYINAINNTVRTLANLKPPLVNSNRTSFSISACTSPKTGSPEGSMVDGIPHETLVINTYHNNRFPIHKVHSSPSLYSLNNNASHQQSNHHFYQHHHQYYQHQQQQHHPHGYQSSRPPHEPRRLTPSSSFARPDVGRSSAPIIPMNQYYTNMQNMGNLNMHGNWSSNGHNMGIGNSGNKHGHYDSRPPSPGNKVME